MAWSSVKKAKGNFTFSFTFTVPYLTLPYLTLPIVNKLRYADK